jgi:protein gp37
MAAFSRRLSWTDVGPCAYLSGDPIAWSHFRGRVLDACEEALPNVWLGVSIEDDRYLFRANHLRLTNAAVRFLSLEPLLGPLPSLDLARIDWVIVGGESGPGARPMDLAWVRDIRDRCIEAGVPLFMKQLGARFGRTHHDPEAWPDDLRIREFPS